MHREAEPTRQPAEPRLLDPVTLTMDLATQVQGITGVFFAAQAGAAQDAIDRLAAHGRRLAEARDPVSILVSHMDCCVSLIEVAIAPFKAALHELPNPRAANTDAAPTSREPSLHDGIEHHADSRASRRTVRTADAGSTSGVSTPAGRRE